MPSSEKGIDYVSVPIAVVEILLELVDTYLYLGAAQEALSLINLQASKKASVVGKVVQETFRSDELANNFRDIETAMEIFPRHSNIYNTSLNLVVFMLLAIEKAIEFFTKHQCKPIQSCEAR